MDHSTHPHHEHLSKGLAERGVTDPHAVGVAQQLHARGVSPDDVLALVARYGPVALQVAEDLIALFGKSGS